MTWVGLLRAVNVAGTRKVPMAELRDLCGGLGWTGVRTHLASGNVVFDADGERSALASALRDGLRQRFGFDVPVVLRTGAELAEVLRHDPFGAPDETFVWFLDRAPQATAEARLAEVPRREGERWSLRGEHLYTLHPEGVTTTKFTADRLDRLTGAVVTARNWRTTTALAAMAT